MENRLHISPKLNSDVIIKILNIFSANPYSYFFRYLKYIPNVENYKICIKSDPKPDQRVYNTPSISQVAAIWLNSDPSIECSECVIIVNFHAGILKTLKKKL